LSLSTLSSPISLSNDYNEKKTPNILEFLEELDKKHGEGEFTQFLDIFSEHSIDVSSIKHLNDDTYFDQMGVKKIGFRIDLSSFALSSMNISCSAEYSPTAVIKMLHNISFRSAADL